MKATLFGRSVSLTVNSTHNGDEYHLSGTALTMKFITEKLFEGHIAFSPIGETITLTERYLTALDTAAARAVLKDLKGATLEVQR